MLSLNIVHKIERNNLVKFMLYGIHNDVKNIYWKVECTEVKNSGGCPEGNTDGWHEMPKGQ